MLRNGAVGRRDTINERQIYIATAAAENHLAEAQLMASFVAQLAAAHAISNGEPTNRLAASYAQLETGRRRRHLKTGRDKSAAAAARDKRLLVPRFRPPIRSAAATAAAAGRPNRWRRSIIRRRHATKFAKTFPVLIARKSRAPTQKRKSAAASCKPANKRDGADETASITNSETVRAARAAPQVVGRRTGRPSSPPPQSTCATSYLPLRHAPKLIENVLLEMFLARRTTFWRGAD